MSNVYQEYSSSATKARPCYSNLYAYGAHGKWKSIIPPTPVTVQPSMFNMMKPHPFSSSGLKPHRGKSLNCGPYQQLRDYCR